jgi:prepilin-type N-terminal cleavage/methylation domain-containing protein
MRADMNSNGFSLLELIVTMAIMGILFGIATLSFFDWQRKSQIERQTREMHTDINSARMESIFRKTRHRVTFQPSSYVLRRYSSDNENYAAGTIINSRNVAYQLTRELGGDISDYSVEFDARGLLTGANFSSPNLILRVNPVASGSSFDCIIIHVARTNMGRMKDDGTSCDAR